SRRRTCRNDGRAWKSFLSLTESTTGMTSTQPPPPEAMLANGDYLPPTSDEAPVRGRKPRGDRLIIVTATPPPDRRRAAWIGCGMLGVVFVLFGLFALIRGENVPTALVALALGAVTIVGGLRLRRSAGGRFASIALRLLLVVVAGSLVYNGV